MRAAFLLVGVVVWYARSAGGEAEAALQRIIPQPWITLRVRGGGGDDSESLILEKTRTALPRGAGVEGEADQYAAPVMAWPWTGNPSTDLPAVEPEPRHATGNSEVVHVPYGSEPIDRAWQAAWEDPRDTIEVNIPDRSHNQRWRGGGQRGQWRGGGQPRTGGAGQYDRHHYHQQGYQRHGYNQQHYQYQSCNQPYYAARAEAYNLTTLFLGNLGAAREEDLHQPLAAFGPVRDLEVVEDAATGEARGYGFVRFGTIAAARACLAARYIRVEACGVEMVAKEAKKELGRRDALGDLEQQLAGAVPTVFLGGTRQLRHAEILAALTQVGPVHKLNLVSKPDNLLESAGFGFVQFESAWAARRLMRMGQLVVGRTRVECRLGNADGERTPVSSKVTLAEAEELVAGLQAELHRTATEAPGGYIEMAEVRHDDVEVLLGSETSQTTSQHIPALRIPRSEAGLSLYDLQELLEEALALRTQVRDCLCERLRRAAAAGDLTAIKHLVSQGADADAAPRLLSVQGADTLGLYDTQAPRSLYLAARGGHLEACRTLLALNVTLDAKCLPQDFLDHAALVQFTPLKAAAELGNSAVVQLLLEAGADANFVDGRRWTILHWAACNDHAEVVRLLVRHGSQPDAVDASGNTPLHLAAAARAANAARVLVEEVGVDACRANERGKRPCASSTLRAILGPDHKH